MTFEDIWALVASANPLDPLFDHLTGTVWSPGSFAEAQAEGRLAQYLTDNEHAASKFERQVYDIFDDGYRMLEGTHPLKQRLENDVFELDQFTLLIFDALSLREIPAVAEVVAEFGLATEVSYGLSQVPSETNDFAKQHFHASGPSAIPEDLLVPRAAFRHVKQKDWQPNFGPTEQRRVIWALYPDDTFSGNHGAISYAADIVAPVQAILRSVLSATPVFPIIVTSDHGFLWQGGQAAWPVDGEEGSVLAAHFKQGRSTQQATRELDHTKKAWVNGTTGAARGRFGWGGQVKGSPKLFKHGGVSLMECLTPWVVVGETTS